jgi:hypothetical protein
MRGCGNAFPKSVGKAGGPGRPPAPIPSPLPAGQALALWPLAPVGPHVGADDAADGAHDARTEGRHQVKDDRWDHRGRESKIARGTHFDVSIPATISIRSPGAEGVGALARFIGQSAKGE